MPRASVWGSPSPSSKFDLTAITDSELLAEAKEVLRKECTGWLNPSQVVGDLDPTSLRTLTLTGQQGTEVHYLLAAPPGVGAPATSIYSLMVSSAGGEVSGHQVAALMHQQAAVRLYDLMNRQGIQNSVVPLTSEELAYFNDGSFFDNGTGNGGDAYLHFSIRNMFLTSQYETPQDIDLFELFCCGSAQPSAP